MKDLKVLFLSVVGSHIYGLAHKDSDYDFKGFGYVDNDFYRYGIKQFEQTEVFENVPVELQEKITKTYGEGRTEKDFKDIVVYDIKKFFTLAASCNPTIIELLFVDPKWMVVTSDVYNKVVENRKLFLSRRVKDSYVGYAVAQLQRIKRHKKWLDNPITEPKREDFGLPKQPKITKEHLGTMSHFPKEVFLENVGNEIHKEIDYYGVLKDWQEYKEWRKGRNPERAKIEEEFGFDLKHGRHLARLLMQGEELLKTGELTVDVTLTQYGKFINDIKDGKVPYEKLVEWANNKMTELRAVVETSILPASVDGAKIDDLLLEITKGLYK